MPDDFLHNPPGSGIVGFGMLDVFSCLVLLVPLYGPLTPNFSCPFLRLLAFTLTVRTSYKSSYAFSQGSQLFASSASKAQSVTALHPAYTAPSWCLFLLFKMMGPETWYPFGSQWPNSLDSFYCFSPSSITSNSTKSFLNHKARTACIAREVWHIVAQYSGIVLTDNAFLMFWLDNTCYFLLHISLPFETKI